MNKFVTSFAFFLITKGVLSSVQAVKIDFNYKKHNTHEDISGHRINLRGTPDGFFPISSERGPMLFVVVY